MPLAPAVATQNLHVAYDATPILHGIDVAIEVGECVAITGANGSGKSTFVKALIGAAPVTGGTIRFYGQRRLPYRRVGYVPQRSPAAGGIAASALEVVRSGTLGRRQWWFPRGSKKAALAALDQVGLAHRANSAVTELSGGQFQRVLIARALVRGADLLLFDEPLAGIDRHSQHALERVVASLKTQGATVIMVLHEFGPLAPQIDRAIHFRSGHIDSAPDHSGESTHE